MTDLMEKSLNTLEYPRILALLAEQATSAEAKERILALRPCDNRDDATCLLAETTAARSMTDRCGYPSFQGVKPVATSLQRAALGGALNPRELLDIAGVLRCTRNIRSYRDGQEEASCIDHFFRSLCPDKGLEERITGAVLSEEEIADSASPRLADLRRHIRSASGKAREVLQGLISSSAVKYLQEPIITIRSDRFVVPVKAEYRANVPGLVHDVSSSGSTFFIEPMGAVKANNQLRELLAQEEAEIQRILAELSALVAERREDIALSYDLLVMLDMIFARAKLSDRMGGTEPRLSDDGSFCFRKARHPLLDAKTAVPIDLELGRDFDTLVVTGPNTGGKTVTLKTAGLFVLMAQTGLHLPAGDGSYCSVYQRVLADIGDEQSIEQSLSTFSSHMTNIVQILAETDEHTLSLFDELGAGTDPEEGAALAVAIIEESRSLGAKVMATTHYAELKLYAMTTQGVCNASCEFNVETLRPTYRLLIGIPGKSNAFAISRRLGLPDHIIDRAEQRMSEDSVRFEDVISQLEGQRQQMERSRQAADGLRRQAEEDAQKASDYRRRLEQDREKELAQARQQAQAILREAREMSDLVLSELTALRKQQKKETDWQEVNRRTSEVRRLLNDAQRSLSDAVPQEEAPPSTRPARQGDVVEILNLGTRAEVVSVGKDNTLQLRAGIMNVTARQDEVRVIEGAAEAAKKQAQRQASRASRQLRSAGAGAELDIRGMMTDECTGVIDRFLDDALLARLPSVTIIHGKGTGALRRAVHQHLKGSRYVKSFRLGRYGEGEAGVTVVELRGD